MRMLFVLAFLGNVVRTYPECDSCFEDHVCLYLTTFCFLRSGFQKDVNRNFNFVFIFTNNVV